MKQNRPTKQGIISTGIVLSILTCFFPPLTFFGMRTWGFIFGNAGFGMVNLQFIDAGMLILELMGIWGFVAVLYYFELASLPRIPHSPGLHSSHKFCSDCGSRIVAGDNFCSECGAKCV